MCLLQHLVRSGYGGARHTFRIAGDRRCNQKPLYLICLDDGKRFKSLKRDLSQLGMTPDEYRAKWSLPRDYPMVAPNYSASRSALSKAAGFGKKKPELKVKAKPTKGRKAGARDTAGAAAAG
jgi:predicted transcriptional regulator